jgi:galactose-1-phosphate uridylyltransferase
MTNSKKHATKNIPILNGYWGIYNEFKSAPEERWDPFRTILSKNNMKIGFHTFISTLRYDRPIEYSKPKEIIQVKALEEGEDSFCHLVEGKLPAIVISKDLTVNKDPLSIEPEFEDLRSFKAFSTINLYPAMPRVFPSKKYFIKKRIIKEISLVHIFSKHYLTVEEITIEELVIYLKNVILTIQSCLEALKAENREKITVHHFYNIGLNAGASIPHLHSQTLFHINISGHGWKNQGFLQAFEENNSSDSSYCLGCNYANYVDIDPLGQVLFLKERLIWEDSHWMILTSFAPEKDGQIRLIPKRHVSAIWQLKPEEIESLAKALIIANTSLSRFITDFGEKLLILQDRNILFRQNYSNFHMLIDIIPIQQVGGAEALDDYRLSSFLPETSAKFMKDLIELID